MKKLIFTALTSYLILFNASAQISILNNNEIPKSQAKPEEAVIKKLEYDSLQPIKIIDENNNYGQINENNKFIGQKIYLLPSSSPTLMFSTHCDSILCAKKYYSYGENKNEKFKFWTNIYKPQNICSEDQFSQGKFKITSSIEDSLINRYYTIIDIYLYKSEKKSQFVNNTEFKIKMLQDSVVKCDFKDIRNLMSFAYVLKDDIRGDTVFYEDKNFISVGYYLKLKQLYEGKNLIWYLGSYNANAGNELYDFVSNKSHSKEEIGNKFYCSAIKLLNGSVVALLKNDKAELILECPNNLSKLEYPSDLFYHDAEFINHIKPKLHQSIDKLLLEEDVNAIEADKEYGAYRKRLDQMSTNDNSNEDRLKECISLFGKKNGKLIANYEVEIGMTKAMCEYAGYQLQSTIKTKSGKTEVLVSSLGRVVLENGIVTKIYK